MNKPSQKRLHWPAALILGLAMGGVVVLLTACSPAGNPAMIGKWTEKNGAVHEFRADGTCSIGDPKSPMAGKYKTSGASRVRIELDGQMGRVVGAMDCKISAVGADTFDLTYPDGEVHHLQKVK